MPSCRSGHLVPNHSPMAGCVFHNQLNVSLHLPTNSQAFTPLGSTPPIQVGRPANIPSNVASNWQVTSSAFPSEPQPQRQTLDLTSLDGSE